MSPRRRGQADARRSSKSGQIGLACAGAGRRLVAATGVQLSRGLELIVKSRRNEIAVAYILMAPFIMVLRRDFHLADHQDGRAELHRRAADRRGRVGWVKNFWRLQSDPTVLDGDLEHLLLRAALGHSGHPPRSCRRARGEQAEGLGAERRPWRLFFFPYIPGRSPVVFRIWSWMFDKDFGVAQYAITPFTGVVSTFRCSVRFPCSCPRVAFVTIWWLLGFNVLLFIAGSTQHFERDL